MRRWVLTGWLHGQSDGSDFVIPQLWPVDIMILPVFQISWKLFVVWINLQYCNIKTQPKRIYNRRYRKQQSFSFRLDTREPTVLSLHFVLLFYLILFPWCIVCEKSERASVASEGLFWNRRWSNFSNLYYNLIRESLCYLRVQLALVLY